MAKKSFLDEHKLRFNEGFSVVEDYDLWVRAALARANFRFIDEILAKYRTHKIQISGDIDNEVHHLWLIINQDLVKDNVNKILYFAAKWKLGRRSVKWRRSLGSR